MVALPSEAPDDTEVTLTVADPAVALLAAAGSGDPGSACIHLTIPKGQYCSPPYEVIGVAHGNAAHELCGSTTIAGTAPGFAEATGTIDVYQTSFSVSIKNPATTLAPAYAGIAFDLGPEWYTDLEAAQDTVVQLTSSDLAVLGSAVLTIANGERSVWDYSAIPTNGLGTASVTATTGSANILPGVCEDIVVQGPALSFTASAFEAPTGARFNGDYTGQRYYSYYVTTPDPVTVNTAITLSSSNASVVTLAFAGSGDPGAASITLTIPAGQACSQAFEVIGVAYGGADGDLCGTATITASASGLTPAVRSCDVYQTAFHVYLADQTLLHPADFCVSIQSMGRFGWINLRAARDYEVSITSTDSSVLGETSVILPNDAQYVWGQAPTIAVGSAALTANTTSLSILNGTSDTVAVTDPWLSFSVAPTASIRVSTGCNFWYFVSVPGPGGMPYPLTVTLSVDDPSVALLSPDGTLSSASQTLQLYIPEGSSGEYFYVLGLAAASEAGAVAGNTVLTATAPAFTSAVNALDVIQSRLRVDCGSAAVGQQVYCGLSIGDPSLMGWSNYPYEPIDVTLTSSDPAVVAGGVLSRYPTYDNYTYLDALDAGSAVVTATTASLPILPGASDVSIVEP